MTLCERCVYLVGHRWCLHMDGAGTLRSVHMVTLCVDKHLVVLVHCDDGTSHSTRVDLLVHLKQGEYVDMTLISCLLLF